jgi:hypothetical protein
MEIWYKVSKWCREPEPVEVIKYTDKSIYIDGRRRAIVSDWTTFYRTYEEAKDRIIRREQSIIKSSEAKIELAKDIIKMLELDN